LEEKLRETAPELEGFKRALLLQHRKRCAEMKRRIDEDLADIITARRIEVEKIVYGLRRACEKHLSDGLRNNRRRAELQKKIRMSELQKGFFDHLEARVRSRAEAFRRSPRYESAMRNLALEALEHFPFPAAALVERGDAAFLSSLVAEGARRGAGEIREIREELRDVWGGLILTEAGKERVGGKLLDNTFRTRWRRLHAAFAEKLWREIHEGIHA
jgi:vacuolar-type H+-ATPase subunit E/Vma4